MQDPTKLSRRVSLSRPLTVVLFYITATVESDGTVRFARDIYGHDRPLDRRRDDVTHSMHSRSPADRRDRPFRLRPEVA